MQKKIEGPEVLFFVQFLFKVRPDELSKNKKWRPELDAKYFKFIKNMKKLVVIYKFFHVSNAFKLTECKKIKEKYSNLNFLCNIQVNRKMCKISPHKKNGNFQIFV